MSANEASLGFKLKVDAKEGERDFDRFTGKVSSNLNVIQGNFGGASKAIQREMADVAQGLAANTGAVGRLASSFGTAGLVMGATAGAAVGVGVALFQAAKSAADAGSKFHDLSIQTGLSVETLSGLQLQLKQSGTDMDALGRAAVFMQKSLGEAASGNKELQRAFAALGVRDVRAALADTDGTLRTVVKSLAEMESAGERNAAGSKVMGRGFKELSVFIKDTDGDLGAVIERAREAGQVMTDEAAEAADRFGDQLDALTHAASTAARAFGMELVPEITSGMAEMTGALDANANRWRAWGAEVANVLRGLREAYNSEFGEGFRRSVGWLWELNAATNPLVQGYRQIRSMGAQSRAGDAPAQQPSPWQAIPSAGRTGGDFFSPAAKTKREKDRKDELDRLKAFAKEWEFAITSITGGRHNAGSLHGQGRAMDVSVRGKSDAEVRAFMEAARRAGFGIRDERTRPPGQKVWSGPHLHLELQNKAVQAAVEAASRALGEQEQILERLARAVAAAEVESRGFTAATADMQVAAEYARLQIGNLTGEAAELAEVMFAQREQQIRARVSVEEHVKALDELEKAMRAVADVPLLDPEDVMARTGPWVNPKDAGTAPGEKTGPYVDPAAFTKEYGEAPPPPNFSPWENAVTKLKTVTVGGFKAMSQAMGQAAAAAIVYGQSFGKAMQQVVSSALMSVAAIAFVEAIKETALGFAKLAGFMPGPAALHFKSAALWALAGTAAGASGYFASGGAGGASAAGEGGALGAGGTFNLADTQRDRTIREGRRGGAPDPNVAQPVAQVNVTLQLDRDVLERKMVHIWGGMGPFRDKVLASATGQPESS